MEKLIYLDNAATTPVLEEVLNEMLPYFRDNYSNPSAFYHFAAEGKTALDKARGQMAALIGAEDDGIYFTGSGTEADNWALKAVAEAYKDKGRHIITSKIEHHAILHTCQYLERNGYEITYLDVDEYGKISLDELREAIHAALWDYAQKNNLVIEGLQKPVDDIGEKESDND